MVWFFLLLAVIFTVLGLFTTAKFMLIIAAVALVAVLLTRRP